MYNCYDYFDGRYESHCEEDQWVRPRGAGEEAADHCLTDTVEDVYRRQLEDPSQDGRVGLVRSVAVRDDVGELCSIFQDDRGNDEPERKDDEACDAERCSWDYLGGDSGEAQDNALDHNEDDDSREQSYDGRHYGPKVAERVMCISRHLKNTFPRAT